MKVRQTYRCGNEWVVIKFTYDKGKLITELKEIDMADQCEDDEYTMPTIFVTDECFRRIINNKKLT